MEHRGHERSGALAPLLQDLVADMTRQPSQNLKETWQLKGYIPPKHLRLPCYSYADAEESTTESRAAAHPSTPPSLYHSSLTINDEVRHPTSLSINRGGVTNDGVPATAVPLAMAWHVGRTVCVRMVGVRARRVVFSPLRMVAGTSVHCRELCTLGSALEEYQLQMGSRVLVTRVVQLQDGAGTRLTWRRWAVQTPYVGVPKYKLWKSPSMIMLEVKLHPHGEYTSAASSPVWKSLQPWTPPAPHLDFPSPPCTTLTRADTPC
jgi:hypothetical protein